jgi:hypothetical protein
MLKIFLILIVFVLNSCSGNKEKRDTSELYAKSQTRQAIIERSGTQISGGSTAASRKIQLQDAENRLRSGGGLFGKKGGISLTGNKSNSIASVGLPINPYLWRASLETIDFMPLSSADPFAGIIITDWYSQNEKAERCKINIYIKGVELKSSNLKVNSFCQNLSASNNWIDLKNDSNENNLKLENAILNKAKKIKLTTN